MNNINDAPKFPSVIKPLAPVRWIIRDDEKVLQQSYMVLNSSEIEWQDVPVVKESK